MTHQTIFSVVMLIVLCVLHEHFDGEMKLTAKVRIGLAVGSMVAFYYAFVGFFCAVSMISVGKALIGLIVLIATGRSMLGYIAGIVLEA